MSPARAPGCVTAVQDSRTRDPRVRGGVPRLLITAGAGYGKSSVLESMRPLGGVVMPTVDLVAGPFPDGVSWIGLDDFHRVRPDQQTRLVTLLDARPEVPCRHRLANAALPGTAPTRSRPGVRTGRR